jgi:hypothetical protein
MKKEDVKLNTFYKVRDVNWIVYVTEIKQGKKVFGYYLNDWGCILYNNTNGICEVNNLEKTDQGFDIPYKNFYII